VNHIRIEVTNCCNLRCKMCPQSIFINRKREMIKDELFKKIIEDIAKHIPGLPLSFHVSGEPLLHPSICSFVRIAGKNLFFPWIVTNATLLTKDMSKRLIDSGLKKISFSFEGINKKIYEEIRVGAIYEKVLLNINNFLRINYQNKKRVLTELVCVDVPTIPVPELQKFLDEMKPKFNLINRSGYVDWLGKIGSDKKEITHGLGCDIMNKDLNILSDGRAVPCSVDIEGTMAYGDFKTMTFQEIMKSKTRMELKAKLESGNFEGLSCSKCYVPSGKIRELRMS